MDEIQLMLVDPVNTATSDVMQTGDVRVVVKDVGKRLMVFWQIGRSLRPEACHG